MQVYDVSLFGPLPHGASNFTSGIEAPLNGHFHMLPAGTELPMNYINHCLGNMEVRRNDG